MTKGNNTAAATSLRYATSGLEVRLVDRVELRSIFLRRRLLGTVVCIPSITGRERQAQGNDPEDWLIRLDSGPITGWLYSPEDLQPPRRLRLVSRASGPTEELSNYGLEKLEQEAESNASWLELTLPPFMMLAALLVVAAGVVWLIH